MSTSHFQTDFSEWVPYGFVRKPHGLRGELKIEPYASADFIPDNITCLRLQHDDGKTLVTRIASMRPTHRGDLIQFDEVPDRTAADAWQGASVAMRREELKTDDDALLICELAGFDVFLKEGGEVVGRVQGVVDHGAQVVLVIDSHDRRRFIPAVDEMILHVDRDKSIVILRLPEGLWDLET